MIQRNSLTEADIRALASSQSFDKGYHYYRRGSVCDVVRRGNLISARVEGSEYEPYQVQARLNASGIADASCTCPYNSGGICKHIIAALLVLVHGDETIEEKPALATLLQDLTAEQLRQVLLGVAEEGPPFVTAIEREIGWLPEMPAAASLPPVTHIYVDINAARREIGQNFRLARSRKHQDRYYDEYDGLEMDPDLILLPHLEKAIQLLDAGEEESAADLVITVIDTYRDSLEELDDWVYEYNEDVFHEATLAVGAVLAELLLSMKQQPADREMWLARIADWEDGLSDLDIAKTAIEQGWTYPPLVAAMQGNISDRGAWAGAPPYYADKLTEARLRILARQGKTQAYINLAEAEGQVELGIAMLAQSGHVEKAVTDAKAYLVYPQEILSIATALATEGEVEAALDVAEHGLSLEQDMGRLDLACWTRERAVANQNHALAVKAAQVAFSAGKNLADYRVVQQLSGEQWPAIKHVLLQELEGSWDNSRKIDIYLHENMLAEAMALYDQDAFTLDHDLLRVIDVVRATHPDWCICQCQKKAERIMDAGKAQRYDDAISWLRGARDIYQQHNRLPEWEQYLDSVIDTHKRKYKLVPLLRSNR